VATVNTVLVINHDNDNFPADDVLAATEFIGKACDFLRAGAAGIRPLNSVSRVGHAVAATGTLTIASGSGPVGGTINGTAKTVTWATSDTASATALAAAINADATLNKFILATSSAGVVTLTAFPAGALGNAVTLVASGTGVTASGAKLTGGLSDVAVSYLP
jgi:phage tail sheath gpL-like